MCVAHLRRHDSLEVVPQKDVLHERVVELRSRLEEGASSSSHERVGKHLPFTFGVSVVIPATLRGRRDSSGAEEEADETSMAAGEQTTRQRSLHLFCVSRGGACGQAPIPAHARKV